MSKRVAIIVLLILFIFAALNFAFTFTQSKQLSKANELETVDTLQNVEKVKNSISAEQGYLDYIVRDWACWNDTYNFIDDKNQNFVDINVQNEILAGIKVNVMLFVNESGSVIYAKSIDIDTAEETPVPKSLLRMVEDGTLLSKSESDTKSGFVFLDENPMLISCHPILTTDYTGPVRGTLIFGRYFDRNLKNSISKDTNSSLMIYKVGSDIPSDSQTKLGKFSDSSNRTIVEPLSEERVAGYFELPDISGKPALIIRADFPRTLYNSFKDIINYMYLFLTFAELMLLGGFWAVQLVPIFDG